MKALNMTGFVILWALLITLTALSTTYATDYYVIRDSSGKAVVVDSRPGEASVIIKGPFSSYAEAEVIVKGLPAAPPPAPAAPPAPPPPPAPGR